MNTPLSPAYEQYKINDHRRIENPWQLEPGMHIGVAALHHLGYVERLRRSMLAAQQLVRSETSLQAILQPWSKKPENLILVPRWHGILKDADRNQVVVDLIGACADDSPRIVTDFEDLPLQPGVRTKTYSDMGLAKSEIPAWAIIGFMRYQNLPSWQPYATVDLS